MRHLAVAILLALALSGCASQTQHAGEFDWAIQGLYSQLDCANQPGTRPYYVESSEHWFFLECR